MEDGKRRFSRATLRVTRWRRAGKRSSTGPNSWRPTLRRARPLRLSASWNVRSSASRSTIDSTCDKSTVIAFGSIFNLPARRRSRHLCPSTARNCKCKSEQRSTLTHFIEYVSSKGSPTSFRWGSLASQIRSSLHFSLGPYFATLPRYGLLAMILDLEQWNIGKRTAPFFGAAAG